MSEAGTIVKIVIGVLAPIVLLIVILVPISFSNLEYNEIGFLRRKSTGVVKTDEVYTAGRYLVGPDYNFKPFPADAHMELMDGVAVFTHDRLEVWVTVSFQYFIRKSQLQLLHDSYDINYEDIIRNNALDALKAAATAYNTEEYITHRQLVENGLFKAVRDRLGGICCEEGCEDTDTCYIGCKPYSQCEDRDKGQFVSVRYFQLQAVIIPSDVSGRYLRALIIQEETEKAEFDQQAAIVERETAKLVQDVDNLAAEIAQNATATSELLVAQANADSTATVERARTNGLRDLYDRLGLTNDQYRGSFDYLNTIRQMDNAHISIDYDQLIAGPNKN